MTQSFEFYCLAFKLEFKIKVLHLLGICIVNSLTDTGSKVVFTNLSCSMSMRRLKRIGIDPELVQRLEKHRIYTCKEFLWLTKKDVLTALGVNEDTYKILVETVSRACAPPGKTALEMSRDDGKKDAKKLSQFFFSTSLPALDAVLQGGLLIGSITEIAGPPSVGKTQFCLMLSVLATLSVDYGGLAGSTFYIDTESTFSAERLKEIAENRAPEVYGCEKAIIQLMNKVMVCQAATSKTLLDILRKLESEIILKNVKLIIIDSIASLLRKEFCSPVERNQMLLGVSSILKDIAHTFNVVVVTTNQITSHFTPSAYSNDDDDVGGSVCCSKDFGMIQMLKRSDSELDSLIPALGVTWAHCVNTRLVAEFVDSDRRQLLVMKSPVAPSIAIEFGINQSGIVIMENVMKKVNIDPCLQVIHSKNEFFGDQKFEF